MIADEDVKQIAELLAELLDNHANVIGNALESVATSIDGLAGAVREKLIGPGLEDCGDGLKEIAAEIRNRSVPAR